MRILNAESFGYSPDARRILAGLGEVVDADLDRTGLLDAAGDADVLIVRLRNQIDAEVLRAGAPRLRVVVSATTGLDHIDQAAAEELGISVLSLKGETDFLRTVTATAEHTWGLLLALIRHIPAAAEAVRGNEWDRDNFRGTELRGKRLGIVGLGRIGSIVANYGQVFQMKVCACDPNLDTWPDGVTRFESVSEMAAKSDVLTVHVPLDETTVGLIGPEVLKALPAGAVIINTSRGEVLDESAVCDLVENGHLGGVAADVVVDERSTGVGRLASLAQRHPRVLVTPHIGGATHDSMARTEVFMAKKLTDHLRSVVGGR